MDGVVRKHDPAILVSPQHADEEWRLPIITRSRCTISLRMKKVREACGPMVQQGVKEFATVNTKDCDVFGFRRVWNPLDRPKR